MVSVVVLQHAEESQLVQQVVKLLLGGGIVLLGVELVQLGACPVLAHLEGIAGKHIQEEVQGGFAGDGVHLILEDAGQAPVLRGFGGHLDLSGNAVRNVADQLDELGVGIFVTKVLGDKLL